MDKEQILADAVRMLVAYDAEESEAKSFVAELYSKVEDFASRFYSGCIRWIAERQLNIGCDSELQKLRKVLKFLINCEAGEYYDGDFNGLSYLELIAILKLEPDAEEYAAPQDSSYKVVRIPSHKHLLRFRQWTEDWCITASDIAFAAYSLDGKNSIYLIVREDYKSVPKSPGASFPNDSYGDSIYCVILDSKGMMESVTNRWNAIGTESENPTAFLCNLFGDDWRSRFD